jgi:superfamily I DNA/RNA helicase
VAKELKDANVVVPCSPRKPTLHDEYEEDPLLPQFSPSRRRKNISFYEACVHAIERGFPELGMVCYNGEPPAGDPARISTATGVVSGDKGKGKGKVKETKRLNPKQQRMVQEFMERIQTLREMGRTNEAGLGRMIDYIVEDVGYGAHLDKKIESESKKEEKRKKDEPTAAEADPNADSRARRENLEELKRRALAFQEEALGEEEELSQELSQQGSPLRGTPRSKATMVSGFLRWICSQSADDDRCV